MVKRFIEFMAKFLNNLKNWFKGLFSKTQAFINKYKDDFIDAFEKFAHDAKLLPIIDVYFKKYLIQSK